MVPAASKPSRTADSVLVFPDPATPTTRSRAWPEISKDLATSDCLSMRRMPRDKSICRMAEIAALSSTRGPSLWVSTSANSAMRRSSSSTKAADHTGSRAPVTGGKGTAGWCESTLLWPSNSQTGSPCRCGATATMTSRRVKVFSSARRPPEHKTWWRRRRNVSLRRPILQARAHRGCQLERWVTGMGQLVPPLGGQVLNPLMAFSVPGGPGRNTPGPVGGVRPDCGVDLSGPGGKYLPSFFWDAGDGPAPESARRPRVGLDTVAKRDRFGRRRHPADSRGGMEMVPEEPGVEALPVAPFVAHPHDICHQDVVVDLGDRQPCSLRGGTQPKSVRPSAFALAPVPASRLAPERPRPGTPSWHRARHRGSSAYPRPGR